MLFNLKIELIKKYPTQADFARVTNISESRLSRIIRGWIAPTENEKEIISRKLGIKQKEIFKAQNE